MPGPMATIGDERHFRPRIITNLARPGKLREMNLRGTPAPLDWRQHFHPFPALRADRTGRLPHAGAGVARAWRLAPDFRRKGPWTLRGSTVEPWR